MNHKKLRRIYEEEKLQVRRRGGRKRALGTRRPMGIPDGPNQRWSLGFVPDAFTKENILLVPHTSLSGTSVTRELDQTFEKQGIPKTIVSDNGTEFTSTALLKWVQDNGINWHYIQTRETHSKRLYRKLQRKLRGEFLNETLFNSLSDARFELAKWQFDYNNHHPHSSIGNPTPSEFVEKIMMDKRAA